MLEFIDLGLRDLLADPVRRRAFFRAITQDEIASQIRGLRKERKLTQAQLAQLADMKQSAVSRIEQAEYSSWTLNTLFKIADALDARLRVIIEDAEAASIEYQEAENNNRRAAIETITLSGHEGAGAYTVPNGTVYLNEVRNDAIMAGVA